MVTKLDNKVTFNSIISVNSLEELFSKMVDAKLELFDKLVITSKSDTAFLYKESHYLSVILPTKFYGAYDPYVDLIYINMSRVKNFKTFKEIALHEEQHQKDFLELKNLYEFHVALKVFDDPIYEENALAAQKLS